MLNVQELERKWLRYKIKSYLPKAVILIVLILISTFAAFYTLNSDDSAKNISTLKDPDLINVSKNEETISPKDDIKIDTPVKKTKLVQSSKKQIKKGPQLTLKPSLSFIDTIKYAPEEEIVLTKPTPKPINKKDIISIPQAKVEKKVELVEPVTTDIQTIDTKPTEIQEEQIVESKMIINFKQEEADIQDVIKRFKKNKNPALSLFIAKRFYALERYQDAYNYALLTNEINPEIEDSWLIAAKSLSHMNKRQKAINLLDDFIYKYHSIRAKMILQQIQDGTL